MDQHVQERKLDEIMEGKASPDELVNFWVFLKKKMRDATPDFNQYWNLYYLQHMRAVFFESCKTFPQYHKFYLEYLENYDGSKIRKQMEDDEKRINYELSQGLKEIQSTWRLPKDLDESITKIIDENLS